MEAAGCHNCLAGAAIIEAMGLRELLRASREETMPIDRSFFLDQPLPGTKRPSDRFERLAALPAIP